VDTFALTLVLAVPVLYGLFWWLDYRWLSERREPAITAAESDPDEEW
jgi:hypothetical protein